MLRSSRMLSQSHFRVSGSRLSVVWLVLTVKKSWLRRTSMVWKSRRTCPAHFLIKEFDCVYEKSPDRSLRKLSSFTINAQKSDQGNVAHIGADCQSTAHHSHQSLKKPRTCTHRHSRMIDLSTAPGLSSDNDPTATSQTHRMHSLRLKCRGLLTPTITPEPHYPRTMHSTNRIHKTAST